MQKPEAGPALEDVLVRHRRLAHLGEMAATLAHQVRTPLTAALLYASNARNEALPADRRRELLDRTVDCLHGLERLVGDMLRFARGAGSADEAATASEVLAGLERSARILLAPGQSLWVTPGQDEVRLPCRREALQGALLNLVCNGLQAAGAGAQVHVSVAVADGHAEFSVSDNGPGVPTHLRRRIFDPFFTTRADGTGLGLAVVRSLAEDAGGEVWVEDAADGGACFVLRLPVAAGTTGTFVGAPAAHGRTAAA